MATIYAKMCSQRIAFAGERVSGKYRYRSRVVMQLLCTDPYGVSNAFSGVYRQLFHGLVRADGGAMTNDI